MARTSITTARYNPFTMEELYSPILRYKEEYNKQQEKYDELANQAAAWNYRLPQTGAARNAYDKYMEDLDAATNDLATSGLMNPAARDNFRSLIRNNPLPALEIANESYQKALDLRTKDPNNVFVQTMPTFDDAFKGTLNNTYRNTDDVTRNAAIIGANIAKTITDDPKYNRILGGQYWQEVQKNGIPLNVFNAVQKNNSEGLQGRDLELYNVLGQALENIRRQIGYNEFAGNDDAQARLNGAIWNGLSTGLQTTKYDKVSNKNFIDSATARQLNLAEKKANLDFYLMGASFDNDNNPTVDFDKAAERTSAMVTAKNSGKGSGNNTPKEPKDPYSVHSITLDEEGKAKLSAGKYGLTTETSNGSNVKSYKNIQEYKANKDAANLIVPYEGWGTEELNQPLTFQTKGKETGAISVKDAILSAYKDRFGFDYKKSYDSMSKDEQEKFGNADIYGVWYIKNVILPYYDVAFGRITDDSRRATTSWEIFMEDKSLGNVPKQYSENTGLPEDNPYSEKDATQIGDDVKKQ